MDVHGVRSPIGRIGAHRLVGEGCEVHGGRDLPPEVVVAGVHRDPMQPGAERGVPAEAPEVAVAGQKGVLGGVARVLGPPSIRYARLNTFRL